MIIVSHVSKKLIFETLLYLAISLHQLSLSIGPLILILVSSRRFLLHAVFFLKIVIREANRSDEDQVVEVLRALPTVTWFYLDRYNRFKSRIISAWTLPERLDAAGGSDAEA